MADRFDFDPAELKQLGARLWRVTRKAARQVPFMEDVIAAYYTALDKDTPMKARGIIYAALGYFVLPTDVIPDWIFGLGFTDDAAILMASITAVRAHMTPAHRSAARKALSDDH